MHSFLATRSDRFFPHYEVCNAEVIYSFLSRIKKMALLAITNKKKFAPLKNYY